MKELNVKELKMTRVCPTCGHQYGLWRYRCEACGADNEMREAAVAAPETKPQRRKKEHADACIECRRRVRGRSASNRCSYCDEPIHRECQRLHVASCQRFQAERERAIQRLEGRTT